ncbi:MAG: DUF1275 domain-containing protein [Herminiimonas sp.]|nr:DUF1275 domain-containing protein [Herminiimonas sp.]
MPILYLRQLTTSQRSRKADRHLAGFLAFIAGAINAGGFLAFQRYTSHMTGIVSSIADNLALGELPSVLSGIVAVLSFVAGAAVSAILINWARRHGLRSQYALPLMLEAGLLLCFGLLGGNLDSLRWLFLPATVWLLCFVMGLQNAMITKLSKAEIRTTHITGMVTDIGIEIGKLLYWNGRHRKDASEPMVMAERAKLALLAALTSLFLVGGVVGALGFKHLGFIATLPLAALLVLLAVVPIVDDVLTRIRNEER